MSRRCAQLMVDLCHPSVQERCKPGLIQHTLGFPLSTDMYGGTFLYHMAPNYVLLGFVIGLSYPNPYVNPYMEFQRLKHHQVIKRHIEGGECIQYGARCINEGGFQVCQVAAAHQRCLPLPQPR